jgi:aryl-alcohol dehydrogenase-like predicted oxidoreductase
MVIETIRCADPKFQPPRIHQYLAAVERIADHAKKRHGRRILSFAIRWILDRGDTMTALRCAGNRDGMPVARVVGLDVAPFALVQAKKSL